jgi:hypothetical protein
MLSKKQKMILHVTAAGLGISEEERRVIQRNIGGFYSSADRTATSEGFAAVMAFYEDRSGGQLDGCSPGYWKRAAAANAAKSGGPSGSGSSRLVYAVRAQAKRMGWTEADVENFLASPHMTNGRYLRLEDTPAYWLSRLLNGMRAIAAREGGGTDGRLREHDQNDASKKARGGSAGRRYRDRAEPQASDGPSRATALLDGPFADPCDVPF